jgi:uncharacterized protein
MATTIAQAADAVAGSAIGQDTWGASLAALDKAQFLSLTTFRRSGAGVTTAVWFARVGQALYVITDDDTGKAKRIRQQPAVVVAPGTARGKPTGAAVDAVAHILPVADAALGIGALSGKYGCLFTMFQWWHRLQGKTAVVLEIVRPA